uniref:Uncharacterized protein n=1 Tax=Marseillevirus LCMAC103 TaxID=2506604 RepID=A0A481YUW1_9VIRU|nr:MAG: hypothetical protein LCMAC103_00100 [Marseillevirus LCMAC103]
MHGSAPKAERPFVSKQTSHRFSAMTPIFVFQKNTRKIGGGASFRPAFEAGAFPATGIKNNVLARVFRHFPLSSTREE